MIHEVRELLTDKLYAGSSAGSMIAGPSIETNTPFFPEEDEGKIDDLQGLELVDFAIVPHFSCPQFKEVCPENLEKFSKSVEYPVYGLDDSSALKVIDGTIEVCSEGATWGI